MTFIAIADHKANFVVITIGHESSLEIMNDLANDPKPVLSRFIVTENDYIAYSNGKNFKVEDFGRYQEF